MNKIAVKLLIAFMAATGSIRANSPVATNPVPRLILELTDGSRLICAPAFDHFKLQTELATLELKLALISMIEFDQDHQIARINLCNGDRMSGQISPASIKVKAAFGDLQVPLAHVVRIMASGGKMALFFGPGSRAIGDDAFLPWGNTPLSYSIWCKLPPYDGQTHVAVIVGAQSRYNDRMSVYLSAYDSWYLMLLEVYGSNAQFSPTPNVVLPETAGQWAHFCAVYADNTLTLYKNGVQMTSAAMKLNRLAQGLFAVGNHNLNAPTPFNEALSDLRIWDRVITAQEVSQVYAGQAVVEGLIGHWPMNEGGGTILYDTSGQQHHLKLEGNPTWVDGRPDVIAKPSPTGRAVDDL
ncbi:MAG: LamG domain-containing protein [Kiritimatiellaeota bacterium]|nr:LamG domain-containing protein [Kiritimatiellota bacterium]